MGSAVWEAEGDKPAVPAVLKCTLNLENHYKYDIAGPVRLRLDGSLTTIDYVAENSRGPPTFLKVELKFR